MTPEEQADRINDQIRDEWAQFRQMAVYEVLINEISNTENEAVEKLISDAADPQEMRNVIQNCRSFSSWLDSMAVIADNYPEDYEPDMRGE